MSTPSDTFQLPPLALPPGITSHYITSPASDLRYHYLSAGCKGDPLLLLLHGFPELAYTWRKVIPDLAKAGYYVVAPDQRGYGRTTGWDTSSFHDVDMASFSMTNLARDAVVLVNALGYKEVHCLVGHDFGAPVASVACMARPDLFRRLVAMSAPISFTKSLPFDVGSGEEEKSTSDLHQDLAQLREPRKYYQMYYSTPEASQEMSSQEGLKDFLHGYIYLKSAEWPGNHPRSLKAATAEEFANMPYYYVMPLHSGMRDAIAAQLKGTSASSLPWLSDAELSNWAGEFARTGFQGGLNWYRTRTNPAFARDLDLFAGRKIEVPCLVIQGAQDWSTYQQPGVIDRLPDYCSQFKGLKMVEGAGHWIEQEKPDTVITEILEHCKVTS